MNIDVRLVKFTKLYYVSYATRISHDSISLMHLDEYGNVNKREKEFLQRLISLGHTSILEHIIFQYEFTIPRFILQELARHRIGVSLLIQSTRYTLKKELLKENINYKNLLFLSGNKEIDKISINSLKKLKEILIKNPKIENDILKYSLPENFKTKGFMTINGRALRHMYFLRNSKRAHPLFQEFMKKIYNITPYREVIFYEQ